MDATPDDPRSSSASEGSAQPASAGGGGGVQPGTKVVPKVWGEEHWIVNREYCGKKLVLRRGYRCSSHYHQEKDEVFYVISGRVLLEVGDEERVLGPGDHQHVPPGTVHRFWGIEDAEIIEFSTHHEDEDSYRLEPSGAYDLAELEGRVPPT